MWTHLIGALAITQALSFDGDTTGAQVAARPAVISSMGHSSGRAKSSGMKVPTERSRRQSGALVPVETTSTPRSADFIPGALGCASAAVHAQRASSLDEISRSGI